MIDQKTGRSSDKYKVQDEQYQFPYHYIPHFDKNADPSRIRMISNGFEYLCYVHHVLSIVEQINPKKVLEVGCGDGRVLNFLKKKDAIGVDLSEKGITMAKAFNPDIEFILGDAGDIEQTFDLVMAVEVLEHIPDDIIPGFWQTIYRRCEQNGSILISVPSVNKPFVSKHFRHYNLERLKLELEQAELTDKLEIQSVEYIYSDSKMIKLWKRFTNNKYWIFEPHFFRKKIWKEIWNNRRHGKADTGYHMVVRLKK